MLKVKKDIVITVDDTHEVDMLRELVSLGLQRLEEVDKPSWGDKYEEHKRWGESFLSKTNM